MIKKYFLPIFIIFAFLTISLFAQDELDATVTEYIAKIVDFNVLIDGEQLLTSNPVVIINGNIYIPIEELEKQLSIEINWNSEKEYLRRSRDQYFGFINPKGDEKPFDKEFYEQLLENEKSRNEGTLPLKITTNVPFIWFRHFSADDKKNGVAMTKEYAGKLKTGMTWSEVEKAVGEPIQNIGSGLSIPGYSFPAWEELILGWDVTDRTYLREGLKSLRENDVKLVYAANAVSMNLLNTEHIAIATDFPFFIDGEEVFIFSPIVMISYNNVYIPLEELAEKLGVELNFNAEKTELNIITKQEEK